MAAPWRQFQPINPRLVMQRTGTADKACRVGVSVSVHTPRFCRFAGKSAQVTFQWITTKHWHHEFNPGKPWSA
jgi:hypothetical protein